SQWMSPPPMVEARRGAPGVCRRSPARRRLCAGHRHRDALLPPNAAALCRAAFACGPFPFPAFETSLAIASPSCASPQYAIPWSRTDAGYLRGIVLDRIVSSTPSVFAAYILIAIVVVFSAEAHGASGSLIHGTLQSALGVRGALEQLTPTPWDCVWV